MTEQNQNIDGDKLTATQWTEKFNAGGWVETLPQDLLKEPTLGKFTKGGVDKVVKSYVELQKAFGDKVPKPRSTFKKDEWEKWNKEYNEGYPESPDKYDLPVPDNPPFDMKEDINTYKKLAHENGLTISQAKSIWNKLKDGKIEAHKVHQEAVESIKKEDTETLRKEWGSAHEEKMRLARNVLQKFASPELMGELGKMHLRADIWKMLANIGDNFKEGTIERASSSTPRLTPSETKLRIAELMAKPEYRDSKHPAHKISVENVSKMFMELEEVGKKK